MDRSFFLLIISAYIAGSVNFSILLFKVLKRSDPREHFSKNAGATNVYRQVGLFWASVVLLLDVGRGYLLSKIALCLVSEELVPWIGLGLVMGNTFPCFHHLRGGKGVATWLGFVSGVAPMAALVAAFSWLLVYGVCRVPFLGSVAMVSVLSLGMALRLTHTPLTVSGILVATLLIFFNHRKNISTLKKNRKMKG